MRSGCGGGDDDGVDDDIVDDGLIVDKWLDYLPLLLLPGLLVPVTCDVIHNKIGWRWNDKSKVLKENESGYLHVYEKDV